MPRDAIFLENERDLRDLIRKNFYYLPTSARVDFLPAERIGAHAAWNPEENEIVIDPASGVSDFSLWFLLSHEKGHAERYPRFGFDSFVTRVLTKMSLGDNNLVDVVRSGRMVEDKQVMRGLSVDIENYVQDSMIHSSYIQTKSLENSDWYRVNANVLRYRFETILSQNPSNYDEIVYPDIFMFHALIQTSLSWLFMASREPGDSPLRRFFETSCIRCNRSFVTHNYRCPHCQTWNLTDEHIPDISFLKDERSILVTKSSSSRVQKYFKMLRDYFIHLLKIPYLSSKYPGGTGENRNTFQKVAYGKLLDTICKLFSDGFYNVCLTPGFKRMTVPIYLKNIARDDVEFLRCIFIDIGLGVFQNRHLIASGDTSLKADFQKRTGALFDDSLPSAQDFGRPVFQGRVYFKPDDDMHGEPMFQMIEEVLQRTARGSIEDIRKWLFEIFQTQPADVQKQWAMACVMIGSFDIFQRIKAEWVMKQTVGGP